MSQISAKENDSRSSSASQTWASRAVATTEQHADLYAREFWGQPGTAGAFVERLFVVGPYPSMAFLKALDGALHPRQLILVVDSGWRATEVEKICKHFRSRVTVRYASCTGLVHAKLYFVEWRNAESTRTSRHLLWGSANASRAAFDSNRNAEALSCMPVARTGEGQALSSYFEQMLEKQGECAPTDLVLSSGLRILLPGFVFQSDAIPLSFEAWVQSGVLCHQYLRDQTFGKIAVRLKKPLPPGELERFFGRLDFLRETEATSVRRSYLPQARTLQRGGSPRWRSSYFVETWLGHWTSFECYDASKHLFKAPNAARRREILNRISDSDLQQQEEWISGHLDALQKVADRLDQNDHRPADYLDCVKRPRRRINREHYTTLARKQIEKDLSKAKLPAFRERFETGYEFPPLPSFRGADSFDKGSFKSFTISLCESILAERSKGKTSNRLTHAVESAIKQFIEEDIEDDAELLLDTLTENWALLGPAIRNFWKEDSADD